MSGGSSGEEKRINQGQGSVDFEATGETNESGGSSHEEKRINQGKGSVEFETQGASNSDEEEILFKGRGVVEFEVKGETNDSGGSSHEEKRITQGKGSIEFEAKVKPSQAAVPMRNSGSIKAQGQLNLKLQVKPVSQVAAHMKKTGVFQGPGAVEYFCMQCLKKLDRKGTNDKKWRYSCRPCGLFWSGPVGTPAVPTGSGQKSPQ